MEETIVVKNLNKTYKLTRKQQLLEKTNAREKTALRGLSFTAYRGEVFGLLGPNGAGKTTTLRILSTLIKADSGTASVEGFDVQKQSEDVRRRIGFLTSELKLEEFFTPNYLFDYFGKLYGLAPDVLAARKKTLFEKFGIDKYAEVKVGELSSGMKQKVSLVVSIVHDPDVIIFDEPTNGLDIVAARDVTDFLLDRKAEGKTILLSTHIFELAEKLCDRVGIIMDGEMTACGTLAELTQDKTLEEKFFELYAGREEAQA
ncbi:MAG: ABC transporter ATP-binding protein [Oscillospiraceae bacterium]|jgi:ABC-type multidrug transport system ATPase subunit